MSLASPGRVDRVCREERASLLVRHGQRRLGPLAAAEVDAHAHWIEGQSGDPLPYYHFAEMCRWYGHLDLWREAVEIAFGLSHHLPEQLVERAHAKLLLGDWSGWRDRESRFFLGATAYPYALRSIRERWDGGESLVDRSLLIVSDGGFGDCIQMLRFLPGIARVARSVTVALQPELIGLVSANFPEMRTCAIQETAAASYDRYVSVLSLPAMAGGLPAFAALRAPAATRRRGIGLCWAGSPLTQMELRQPLSLDAFAPLLGRDDMCWYSLQIGPRAGELAGYPGIAPPPEPLATFVETANLIAGLDAVVTVDTSVAHLAGSLGVPTWLLLHVVADPRWGLAEATPWYPSMRLIRQRRPGDWSGVIGELASCIDQIPRVAE